MNGTPADETGSRRPVYVGRKNRGAYYGSEGNFKKDVQIAKKTENTMACALCDILGDKRLLRSVEYLGDNRDSRYDFSMAVYNGNISREKVVVTVEVKEDQRCSETGNVGVEYRCCGEPSGINVSEADFYVYHVHTGMEPDDRVSLLIRTEDLKKAIADRAYFRTATSFRDGPDRPADNYLFKLPVMKSIAAAFIDKNDSACVEAVRSAVDEKLRVKPQEENASVL